MNRVVLLGFGQGELEILSLEPVPAVVEPVGPGDQGRAVGSCADLIDRIRVEHRSPVHLVGPNTAPDLHDRGFLITV